MSLSDAQRTTLSSLIRAGGEERLTWQMDRTIKAMERGGLIAKARGSKYRITAAGRAAHEQEWASLSRRVSPARHALPVRPSDV